MGCRFTGGLGAYYVRKVEPTKVSVSVNNLCLVIDGEVSHFFASVSTRRECTVALRGGVVIIGDSNIGFSSPAFCQVLQVESESLEFKIVSDSVDHDEVRIIDTWPATD